MSQRMVTSNRPVQVCWAWAGHRPQSKGQPRRMGVCGLSGYEGLLGRDHAVKGGVAGAPGSDSHQTGTLNVPWSGQVLHNTTVSALSAERS